MTMTDLNLTQEEQFIIACLRSEFSSGSDNEFPAFDYESFDWNRVYNKSLQWRIAPLLYKSIEKRATPKSPLIKGEPGGCQKPNIPKEFLEKIKVEYLITCVAYNSIYESLAEISGVFQKAGIKVILLKGSHLAKFVYEYPGMRPMGDIDILVKKEDLSKTEELLLQMGYTQPIDTKSSLHLPYFSHPEKIRTLEVHWTITKPIWQFNIDVEGIWEKAKTERKNGIDMFVFSLEDLLLYLSLHATYQHNLRTLGLVPFCDIAAIIHNTTIHEQIPRNKGGEGGCEQIHKKEVFTHKYPSHRCGIDWDKLQARAHEWGIAKYLYLSLYLSHEILGTSVPEGTISAFTSEPSGKKIASEAIKRILSIKVENSPFTDAPHLFYDDFHPHNNPMRRTLFIFQKIFIPREKLAAYYALSENSKRIYFYYCIRFFSLPYRYFLYYANFYVYWLTHKKGQVYGDNLDLWLLFPDSKSEKICKKS